MDAEAMAVRCPTAHLIDVGILPRHIFQINTHGVATVIWTGEAYDYVVGVLWKLAQEDERMLDVFEGLGYAYCKRTVPIERKDGNVSRSMIYQAIDSRIGRPKNGYLEDVIGAAQDHQFPHIYIERLKEWKA
ncbi:MAG: gamma-glutamylcyclotransferase [Methylocystaceae bacterium]|nr:gamma-glutamylcyclotransferase [Methylocystaceae bacterium]